MAKSFSIYAKDYLCDEIEISSPPQDGAEYPEGYQYLIFWYRQFLFFSQELHNSHTYVVEEDHIHILHAMIPMAAHHSSLFHYSVFLFSLSELTLLHFVTAAMLCTLLQH